MPGCVALNCTNRTEKGFRLFQFPSDPFRRSIWTQNVQRGSWQPTRSSNLCEVHFDSSQFESRRADGWLKLKPNAIPTLFDFPQSPSEIDCTPQESLYENLPLSNESDLNQATSKENNLDNYTIKHENKDLRKTHLRT